MVHQNHGAEQGKRRQQNREADQQRLLLELGNQAVMFGLCGILMQTLMELWKDR